LLRPTACWLWDNSETAYVDYTDEVKSNTDFNFLDDANDKLYIGLDRPIAGLYIDLTTNGSYTGVTFDYYDTTDAAFSDCSLVDSYNFDESKYIRWTVPSTTGTLAFSNSSPHSGTVIDTNARYWIRLNVTAVTTQAVIDKIRVIPYNMYATHSDITKLMQCQTFTTSTTPAIRDVEDSIVDKEDWIDYITHKSWRFNAATEYVDYNRSGFWPRYRNILKVYDVALWNGNSWESQTEGRDQDFFVNYDRGMIYMSRQFLLPAGYGLAGPHFRYGIGEFKNAVKIDYAYGRDWETDKQFRAVQDITKKMTAIDLIANSDYTAIIPSGVDKVALVEKIRVWEEQIAEKLEGLKATTIW
jgi:hypothetical protein